MNLFAALNVRPEIFGLVVSRCSTERLIVGSIAEINVLERSSYRVRPVPLFFCRRLTGRWGKAAKLFSVARSFAPDAPFLHCDFS